MRLTEEEIEAIARKIAERDNPSLKKPVIAGNWKMHASPSRAEALIKELVPLLEDSGCEIIIAPPFPSLDRVARVLSGTGIRLAAQNVHWEREGAFTGEVSTVMLADLGVSHVILGHSERRQLFGETNESVNRRLKAVLEMGMTPLVCVGETREERSRGITSPIVRTQINGCLEGVGSNEADRLIIAYEPVWAIGTGQTATPGVARAVHSLIRDLLVKRYPRSGGAIPIVYGGSVNARNASSLLEEPDIDGALVGGASLHPSEFAAICRSAEGIPQTVPSGGMNP